MLSYCLKCRRNTESINPRVPNNSIGKSMILSKFATCGSKKSKIIIKQEAKGILNTLGFKNRTRQDSIYWRLSSLNAIPLNATPLNAIMYKKVLSYCLKCKK